VFPDKRYGRRDFAFQVSVVGMVFTGSLYQRDFGRAQSAAEVMAISILFRDSRILCSTWEGDAKHGGYAQKKEHGTEVPRPFAFRCSDREAASRLASRQGLNR